MLVSFGHRLTSSKNCACPIQVLRENNKEHVAITLESSSSLPAPQMQPEPVKDKSK